MAGVVQRDGMRDFGDQARAGVRELYRLHHTGQTVAFVADRKRAYLPLRRSRMSILEAMDALESVVDESDPDLDLPQRQHALQTAEAMRADGRPRWMVLTGFIHDLGKLLCLFGEPQWAVVGDTFPVGCAWAPGIVYRELLAENPDARVPDYQTDLGIYRPHCGLDALEMSWGHDEYLYL